MKKKIVDITNRFNMAVAERNGYEKGSKYYEQLSEVIEMILKEYRKDDGRKNRSRYGFRMDSSGYRLVVLENNELF